MSRRLVIANDQHIVGGRLRDTAQELGDLLHPMVTSAAYTPVGEKGLHLVND